MQELSQRLWIVEGLGQWGLYLAYAAATEGSVPATEGRRRDLNAASNHVLLKETFDLDTSLREDLC